MTKSIEELESELRRIDRLHEISCAQSSAAIAVWMAAEREMRSYSQKSDSTFDARMIAEESLREAKDAAKKEQANDQEEK